MHKALFKWANPNATQSGWQWYKTRTDWKLINGMCRRRGAIDVSVRKSREREKKKVARNPTKPMLRVDRNRRIVRASRESASRVVCVCVQRVRYYLRTRTSEPVVYEGYRCVCNSCRRCNPYTSPSGVIVRTTHWRADASAGICMYIFIYGCAYVRVPLSAICPVWREEACEKKKIWWENERAPPCCGIEDTMIMWKRRVNWYAVWEERMMYWVEKDMAFAMNKKSDAVDFSTLFTAWESLY